MLTKEQAELRANDRPWHEGEIITDVSKQRGGWSISAKNSGFFISRKQLGKAKPPEIGDEVAVYTVLGSTIRGIDLRGEPLFYKTQAELDVEHEQWVAKHKADKRKRFEKDRRGLDRDFASLPIEFQRRISWFRANDPEFRWDSEGYEMVCCVDAVKIAEACGTPAKVRRFQKRSYEKQRELVPSISDQHSGNTFAMACRLAFLYLENPVLVIAEHAAMSPLAGCDGCGCAHPRPKDVMEALDAISGT